VGAAQGGKYSQWVARTSAEKQSHRSQNVGARRCIDASARGRFRAE